MELLFRLTVDLLLIPGFNIITILPVLFVQAYFIIYTLELIFFYLIKCIIYVNIYYNRFLELYYELF